jgi:hypothetical protein
MIGEEARIVHFIPGRLRVRIGNLKDNPTLAHRMQEMLADVDGVEVAKANPLTGSLLIQYDPEETASLDVLLGTAERFGLLPSDFDQAQLRTWMYAQHNGNNGTAPHPLRDEIITLFRTANRKVDRATGGTSDLSVLVPVGFVLAGVLKLLFIKKTPTPAWYEFLWFGFNLFAIFNLSGSKGK